MRASQSNFTRLMRDRFIQPTLIAVVSSLVIGACQIPCFAADTYQRWSQAYEAGEECFENEQFEDAEVALVQALKLSGGGITKQIITLQALADVFHKEKKYDEEIRTVAYLIMSLEQIDGYPPLFIGALYLRVSSVLYDKNELEDALQFATVSTSLMKEYCGSKSPNLASALNNQAWIEYKVGQVKEAERNFLKSLRILEKAVGTQDFHYGMVAHNLADVYDDTDQVRKSLKWNRKAKEVLAQYPGTDEIVRHLNERYNVLTDRVQNLHRRHSKTDTLSRQHRGEIEF